MVVRTLKWSNFGFLGNFYCGMLDMYTDLTLFQAKSGSHVTLLEMSDLERSMRLVTEDNIQEKLVQINSFFRVLGDSPADPIVKKPTAKQIRWSATVASAQEKMVREYGLDGIAYYYHGYEDHFEEVQGGFIVGHSLLTAAGVPCSGEGDIKTAMAMRVCDLLGVGGSFCEIVTTDYYKDMLSIGHDGPFHIDITTEKPVLRGLQIYHGKRGSGISVEAAVRPGDVTTFAVVQTVGGKFRFVASEGIAHKAETMYIGNTETHVEFGIPPIEFYNKWFEAAPTHHFALSVGRNISTLRKIAKLLAIEFVEV
jgi:L-arabinose isomerase